MDLCVLPLLFARCNNTELWVTCTATSLNLVPITLNPHITTLGLHNSQVIVSIDFDSFTGRSCNHQKVHFLKVWL